MQPLAVTLLLLSTTISTEPHKAPSLDPLPKNLPLAVRTPAPCQRPGTWLPSPLDNAINKQREQCKRLPARCQARLDATTELCEHEKELERAVGRQEGHLQALQEYDRNDLLERVTWGIGGVIIGVIITAAFVGGMNLGG